MAETVAELLLEGRRRLARAAAERPPFRPATREAALLLGRVLGRGEAGLLARDERPVPPAAAARYRELLDRRLTGEPIAYILGAREFYGRDFRVDSRALVPRPETEHLIEAALELTLPDAPRVLDVGTGSGCIAVTLALELAGARVLGIDSSPAALALAAANVRAHRAAARVRLAAGDLTSALDLGAFDLVVANPPYVDPAVRGELSPEVVEFEPEAALFAPGRGRAVLERLCRELGRLRPSTPVLLEIGHDQGDAVRELAAASGLRLRELRRDLAGHPRVALLERGAASGA